MSIFSALLPSRTWSLAVLLVPLLGRAFDFDRADDWVYDRLPKKIQAKGTLAEFEVVIKAGKAFLKACYEFLHQ